jgi:hypothetical protein
MIIKLFWPECKYFSGEWSNTKIDSYWIECTLEEAKNKVFPYLLPEKIEESLKNWDPKEQQSLLKHINRNLLCFLISKDLKSIEPLPWFYPYSGQWGAYCPFNDMKEVHIDELIELCKL